MNRIKVSTATLLVLALSGAGCASHSGPIVDRKGLDEAKYAADLAECEEYAHEISIAEGTARGATLGAIVGAAVGSVTGNTGEGASYGAATGGVRSGIRNADSKDNVVKRCLSGRGYRVLN